MTDEELRAYRTGLNHKKQLETWEVLAGRALVVEVDRLRARERALVEAATNLVAFWDAQPDANLTVVEQDELTHLESELRAAIAGGK